ncbi:hypothetical protein [Zobellella iuensis]|uniref:Uncharacterized protein n=1 Tax=Zobellella iuensis TaxID=2803811 RepID=A0ABS1QMP2_9GAMM|nr:hypothetical protein [Zobellella iuensis]MBL1375751.1 hypothetical protein [Zobellella iuensis]
MNMKWVLAGLLFPLALQADDTEIQQAIEEGRQAYQAGELSRAAAQFDYAATLIRQQQAGELGARFPEPLPGWQADSVDTQAGSAAFFGGGINASRHYNKSGASLDITITKDSPLLQTMAVLFSNPSMAAMGGYKVKRIRGHTAMVKEEGDNRELQMLIANTTLLQLSGRGMSEAEFSAYAEAVDIEALTGF